MSLRTKSLPVLAAVLAVCLSTSARAQGPSLTLGHATRHGSIELTLGVPLGHPSYTRCEPRRTWVAGHYETRCESVWIAGCTHDVWMPAQYEWRWGPWGRAFRICVRAGYGRAVTDPGHYESRNVQVWVPGAWRWG
jgi:hypothetical protein